MGYTDSRSRPFHYDGKRTKLDINEFKNFLETLAMIENYPVIKLPNNYYPDRGNGKATKKMLRSHYLRNLVFVYEHRRPENNNYETELVANKPFYDEMIIMDTGSTNRSSFIYLLSPTQETIYPTFGGFLTKENLGRINNNKIKGWWMVQKKGQYYGIIRLPLV